ncbi:MAG TPA: amino acid permease [Steroidobacteraceae bacterium]|nr:amino acid permease [Steroidobacteraceae bacterium]
MPATTPAPGALARNLRSRHIQLIAIGGTIGVGLFLGSAQAIHKAGPGLLLAYLLGGIAIFFIMRALGELLTYRPVAGSFATYAEEFCGPFAGFVTGWSYWFMWVVTAMAELTAIGIYVRYWLPEMPQWLPPLVALALLYGANLLAVRVFGELEFWFALIKVLTIVALILAGLAVIFFHIGELGATAGFANLHSHGGFMPFGIAGVLLTLQIVMFAYSGVELIGVTAGEAADPHVVLPRATNGIILRILIFYLGALLVIMSVVPWNQLSPEVSPFVFVFEKLRVPAAASLITAVVITAAASSCNSGLFSTGRMLWSLAQRGQGPRAFARLNARQVPAAGIHASAAVMLLAVALNYLVPKEVFTYVTSIALIGTLWTWGIILVSHRNYRRAVAAGRVPAAPFRMPGAPLVNWLVLAFLVAVTALLWLDRETRVALFVAPFWFALLGIGYAALRRNATSATPT